MQTHTYTQQAGKHFISRNKIPRFKAEYNFLDHTLFNILFLDQVPEEKKPALYKKALAFLKSTIQHNQSR